MANAVVEDGDGADTDLERLLLCLRDRLDVEYDIREGVRREKREE